MAEVINVSTINPQERVRIFKAGSKGNHLYFSAISNTVVLGGVDVDQGHGVLPPISASPPLAQIDLGPEESLYAYNTSPTANGSVAFLVTGEAD